MTWTEQQQRVLKQRLDNYRATKATVTRDNGSRLDLDRYYRHEVTDDGHLVVFTLTEEGYECPVVTIVSGGWRELRVVMAEVEVGDIDGVEKDPR